MIRTGPDPDLARADEDKAAERATEWRREVAVCGYCGHAETEHHYDAAGCTDEPRPHSLIQDGRCGCGLDPETVHDLALRAGEISA